MTEIPLLSSAIPSDRQPIATQETSLTIETRYVSLRNNRNHGLCPPQGQSHHCDQVRLSQMTEITGCAHHKTSLTMVARYVSLTDDRDTHRAFFYPI